MTGLVPRDMREWVTSVERGLRNARGAAGSIAAAVVEDRLANYADIVEADRNRRPAPPITLTTQTYIALGADKHFHAGVILDFPDVSIGDDALPMDIERYELWGRTGTDAFVRLTTATVSALQWFGADPGSVWDFKARAIGALAVKPGVFSATVSVTMTADSTAPGQPSTPTATTQGKTVTIKWDGKIAGGADMPLDLDYVIVAGGTASSPTTEIARFYPGPGIFVDTAVTYSTTKFYRLRAVDTSGNLSAWSAQVTGTPAPLVDADMIISAINAATTTITNIGTAALIDGAINTAKLAANAVTTGKLDATIATDIGKGVTALSNQTAINTNITNLQTSVSGKNTIVNSLSVASGTSYVGGDRWQQWSSLGTGGKLLASWRYNGSAWVAELIDPVYIPQIDIGAGTFGSLDGGRLTVNSVRAGVLMVTDPTNFAPSMAESPADWALTNGMQIVTSTIDASGKRFHAFENTAQAYALGPYNAVKPGQKLYAAATLYRAGGGTNAAVLRYHWYDKDKVALGTPYDTSPTSSTSPNGTVYELTSTVPATAAYARYAVAISATAGAGSGITTGFYNVSGYRQNSTVLIEDGAISGNKVNAASVAATVGSFLTINVSQLNATAAAIDTGVIDKLWTNVVQSRKIGTEMLVVTGENLVPDPFFFDDVQNTYRLATGGPHYLGTDSATTAKILQFRDHTPTGSTVRLHDANSRIKVIPGEEYNFVLDYRYRGVTNTGNPVGNIKFTLYCDAPDGSFLRSVNLTNYTRVAANGTGWLTMNEKWQVAADVGFIRIAAAITNEISTGDVELRFPRMKRKISADLVVDGGILTRHLTVTEDMTVALLNVHQVKANEIDTNDLAADAGFIAYLDTNLLTADVIDATQIKADAITSKHTITGATIQTLVTANRGVKISGGNLTAYDSTGTGAKTFEVIGSTGAVTGTGVWQTGTSGNYVKMYANVNGGILHMFTGSGSGRGSIWARDGGDPKMSLTYSNLDEPTGTLPVVVLKPTAAYMNYGQKTVKVWSNSGTEELLLDAGGTSVMVRGGLELQEANSRVRFRHNNDTTTLGYVGQRPETSVSVGDFEVRAAVNGVRLSGTELIANPIYSNTSSSAANVFVDSNGKVWRSTSASKYKADQQVLEVPDSLLDIPMKDWVDKNQMALFEEMNPLPRPFMESDQQRFDAINLLREPGVIAEDVEAAGGAQFTIYGPDAAVEGVKYERLALAQIQVLKRKLDEALVMIAELQTA